MKDPASVERALPVVEAADDQVAGVDLGRKQGRSAERGHQESETEDRGREESSHLGTSTVNRATTIVTSIEG